MTSPRRKIFLVLAVLFVITAFIFPSFSTADPVYKGKTLSALLDDLFDANHPIDGPVSIDETRLAVREIGPKAAIPTIIRKLNQNDSPLRNKTRGLWADSPKFLQDHLPEPTAINFTPEEASEAFTFLGTNAVSYLLPHLKDRNPAVREAVLKAFSSSFLSSLSTNKAIAIFKPFLKDSDAAVRMEAAIIFGKIGPAASASVPDLITALQSDENGRHDSDNEQVPARLHAADALGKIGASAMSAVPALTNAMLTNDPMTCVYAAYAVWQITSNKNLVLPALTNLLASKDPYIRVVVAVTHWRISSNASFALPILMTEMPRLEINTKSIPVETFAEMGPQAKEAFPVLVKELSSTRWPALQSSITNALHAIDPEAAAKLFNERNISSDTNSTN